MGTFVVLLRGINVGGKAKVPMPALRDALGEAGFEDVATYVQSGNVVLGGSGDVAAKVRKVVKECAGVECAVVVRTPKELAAVVKGNPFSDESDPKKVHVVFCDKAPAAAKVKALDPDRSPGDSLSVKGKDIYLHYPNGYAKTKLTLDWLERQLGVTGTGRNWRTVLKLAELSS